MMDQENIHKENRESFQIWCAIGLIIIMSVVISGCSLFYTKDVRKFLFKEKMQELNALEGLQPISLSLLQTEVERYEITKGLSCEGLSEIYDTSKLNSGSMVKAEVKQIIVNRKLPNIPTLTTTKILTDINTNYGADNYGSDGRIPTGTIFAVDILSEQPRLKIKEEDVKNLEPSFAQEILRFASLQIMTPLAIHNFLLNVADDSIKFDKTIKLISNATWGKSLRSEKENKHEVELKRIICSDEPELASKIVDIRLVSQENIIIAGNTIPTKIYQVDKIKKSGDKFIMNDSAKLWVSDEIPFGIVKAENKSFLMWQIDKDAVSQEIITNYEVTEFKY